MSKKKKEKVKNKTKGTSFFSSLNTDSTIEYGYAEKNPKSKWAKWIIATLVLGATATGIAVPWALSSTALSVKLPYSNKDIMYTYFDPITNQTVSVTYEEFKERVDNIQVTNTVFDKWDDVFYNQVLENLYNEERKAFFIFKEIYKKIHNKDTDNKTLNISDFGADLTTSFSEIEENQRKILEDNKKSFQKATGKDANWLNKWINELQTNSIYGPQVAEPGTTVSQVGILEQKAIDYMTNEQIKTAALARYKGVSITSTTWNYVDYQFANNYNLGSNASKEFLSFKYNDGVKDEEIKITYQQAQDIWKSYLTGLSNLDNFDGSNGINAVLPKVNSTDETKVIVLETKSYSQDFRNPLKTDILYNLVQDYYKYNLVSSFALGGLTPGENNSSAFSISSDFLKNLFKVDISYGPTPTFIPISRLSSYQGANLINTSNNKTNSNYVSNNQDDLLVKRFNSDTNNLGSSQLKETSTLFTTSTSSSNDGSSQDSSNTSKSSDDSSSDSSSSLSMFYISALTSSLDGAISNSNDNSSLFSINTTNPFSVFMKLLFTINDSNMIDLSSESQIQKNWNDLSYGSLITSADLGRLLKFLKNNLDNKNFQFIGNLNPEDFNSQLVEMVDKLASNDYVFLGELFNAIMIGDTSKVKMNYEDATNGKLRPSQVGYWTIYQLSEPSSVNNNIGTYMYVSSSEVRIFAKNKTNLTINDVRKMAVSDLILTSQNTDSTSSTNTFYDVSSMFSKLDNINLQAYILLQDGDNKTKFKDGIKDILKKQQPDISSDLLNSESEDILNDFSTYVQSEFIYTINEASNNIVTNIWSTIKSIIDSNRVYDFATVIDDNGMKEVAFQTQSKYNLNSIAINQNNVEDLFIKTLQNVISIQNVKTKGVK